jgi:hypothetical protein
MRFEGARSGIRITSVLKQRCNIALVVDLNSLLGGRWMVSRRCGLEDKAVDGREYEKLADKGWHRGGPRIIAGLQRVGVGIRDIAMPPWC